MTNSTPLTSIQLLKLGLHELPGIPIGRLSEQVPIWPPTSAPKAFVATPSAAPAELRNAPRGYVLLGFQARLAVWRCACRWRRYPPCGSGPRCSGRSMRPGWAWLCTTSRPRSTLVRHRPCSKRNTTPMSPSPPCCRCQCGPQTMAVRGPSTWRWTRLEQRWQTSLQASSTSRSMPADPGFSALETAVRCTTRHPRRPASPVARPSRRPQGPSGRRASVRYAVLHQPVGRVPWQGAVIVRPAIRVQSAAVATTWADPPLNLMAVVGVDITGTTGLLLRKRLQISREWSEQPLLRLTATIRLDAVLREQSPIGGSIPGGPHETRTGWHSPASLGRSMPVSADPPSAQADRPLNAEDGYPRLAILDAPPSERSGGLHPTLWPRRDESSAYPTRRHHHLPRHRRGDLSDRDRPPRLPVEISRQRATVIVDTTPTERKYLCTCVPHNHVNDLANLPTC